MSIVSSLPTRPLTSAEIAAIEDSADDRIALVREETDEGVVHFYVQTEETLYSLVYGDGSERWRLDAEFDVGSTEWERHTAEWFDESTDEEFEGREW